MADYYYRFESDEFKNKVTHIVYHRSNERGMYNPGNAAEIEAWIHSKIAENKEKNIEIANSKRTNKLKRTQIDAYYSIKRLIINSCTLAKNQGKNAVELMDVKNTFEHRCRRKCVYSPLC